MDIKIPFTKNSIKDVQLVDNIEDNIKINLRNLLSKSDTKRPFREDINVNYNFLYQNGVTPESLAVLQSRLNQMIRNFETRINVTDILTDYYTSQKKLIISIKYVIKNISSDVKTTSISLNL